MITRWQKSPTTLPFLLRYYVFLNREIESIHNLNPTINVRERERIKGLLFNILPLCSIRSHSITIDTSVMYGILMQHSSVHIIG